MASHLRPSLHAVFVLLHHYGWVFSAYLAIPIQPLVWVKLYLYKNALNKPNLLFRYGNEL